MLDLGVGTGRFALPLRERGFEMVGVDLSPKMLAVAKAPMGVNHVTAAVPSVPISPVPSLAVSNLLSSAAMNVPSALMAAITALGSRSHRLRERPLSAAKAASPAKRPEVR